MTGYLTRHVTLGAFLIGPGTVLFRLRSNLLRLQVEMPCARTDQVLDGASAYQFSPKSSKCALGCAQAGHISGAAIPSAR